ncbi:MAG: response regulator, partial [Calditrichaeota bacterium]
MLIVDDEEDLTWTLSKKLSKDSDKFEVICVNSGREAIEVLNQLPVDLVITDVRMPEVSGLDLLVDIKRLYPDTKVTIMTAYGSPDVQQEASQRGCFDYIEKPFEINELRKRIIESLEQKRGFRGSIADFQLADIVQLNCLGRITSTLKVRGEGGEGTIYFRDGNVVHAEAGHLEGESAFFYMMSWSGGEFQVFRNMPPARETITRGWQSLLLESMRLLDESSDLAK